MNNERLIKIFRGVALAEGISFIILLGIAMPLKYFAGLPEAVKITGMIHGLLFLAFLALTMDMMGRLQKKVSWLLLAFICAIVPLGTFYFEKQLKKEV